jgi:hypothetical protein
MLAGEKLRTVRDKLGFTLKDVEIASLQVVEKHKNPKYWIPQSRLSHIESKGLIPNIYRLHALCMVYRLALAEVLGWYGIGENPEASISAPPKTHLAKEIGNEEFQIPVRLDPLFDDKKTGYIRRMIQEWGVRPMMELQNLQQGEFTYGYVGTEDYCMYPLILPGTFVQIDQRLTEIETGPWASEWERPVYFLETHETYICSWCAVLSSREIQVQPHTLSGLAARNYKLPNEIQVVGQVVGIATKLRRVSQVAEREPAMIRAHI